MKSSARSFSDNHQKQICRLFDGLCGRHSRWSVWQDFIVMSATAISNTVDKVHAEKREKTYMTLASKYNEKEMQAFSEMLCEVVLGFDENPNQDFLGELYMGLELGNDHAGQFFTPYCICEMMSQITEPNLKDRINERGWISVSDPACGAGALLVSFANECLRQKVNYQTSVLFVAQDIDYIVGCMCYLQLSIIGCAGYVVIDNSLTKPSTSYDPHGLLPKDEGQIWYTPMFFRQEWHWRKTAAQLSLLSFGKPEEIADSKETADQQTGTAECDVNDHPETPAEPEEVEYKENKKGQLMLF